MKYSKNYSHNRISKNRKEGTYHSNDKPKFYIIPKGVANMENLFDLRERFKGPKNDVITEISSATSHANGYRNTTSPNTY
jgi:hypothetical protein